MPKNLISNILQDIEAKLGERDSRYEHGPIKPIQLEGDKIILEIPEEAVCGWKMVGQNLLEVSLTVVCTALNAGTCTSFLYR